ncbi:MAG: 1-acyl-sn-glycerol-3-phosphate acyltransferase [Kiritimatiellia bacterium]|jgi:1-acyl-sn-glycerol-3-phosphate acyltransferase
MLATMRNILDRLGKAPLTEQQRQLVREAARVNSVGYDHWGLNVDTAERALRVTRLLYREWFRVRTFHTERIPPTRIMLVANHGGQIPLDGMLIVTAMMLDVDPPRIVRGMVERWLPALPYLSTLFVRCGQVVGAPENCKQLLEHDQSIMVFPEGAKGSGKSWWKRYQLQSFGTGFMRLAIETNTPIVPVAVIGSDDTYPAVFTSRRLGKLMGAPYFPITPTFPWLGPLGLVPLPVQIDLRFGEPMHFGGDADLPDAAIRHNVQQVKTSLQHLLDEGLAARPKLQELGKLSRWRR